MKHQDYKINAHRIKEGIEPNDFYLLEQNLSIFGFKSGKWAVAGLCPFHMDSRVGSFKINRENGAFICFSCNEKGGDIISYTIKKYNVSFHGALKKLANEWRIS